MKMRLILMLLLAARAEAFTLNSTSDSSVKGWANREVAFRLNTTNCPANIRSVVENALAIWNGVPTTDLVATLGADTTTTVAQYAAGTATDVPGILCDTNFSANSGLGGNGVAGVARVGTPPTGGNISYAYLLINVESGSSGNVANSSATVLSIVLAHEIGHVLGLGHSSDTNALMYYNASAKAQLSLAQDDIDGITYLYPRNELNGKLMGCGVMKALDQGDGPSSMPPMSRVITILILLAPLAVAGVLASALQVRRNTGFHTA